MNNRHYNRKCRKELDRYNWHTNMARRYLAVLVIYNYEHMRRHEAPHNGIILHHESSGVCRLLAIAELLWTANGGGGEWLHTMKHNMSLY